MATPECTSKCTFSRKCPGIYVCKLHGKEHACGRMCTAPKHVTNSGSFCTFTGVETCGPAEVLYNNPVTCDSFKRRRGGAHWTSELIRKPKIKQKKAESGLGRHKQHSRPKVIAALRKIFTSSKYQLYIAKEKGRRKSFIESALGKQPPFAIADIALLARHVAAKSPGASRTVMTMKDPRLDVLSESIMMYYRHAPNAGPLNAIKNTGAFVAAILTLLTTGLAICGRTAFPRVDWLQEKLPPPVAMTSVGIPCRSVSLAVRELKKHVYGADFNGIRSHFFTLVKHRVRDEANAD